MKKVLFLLLILVSIANVYSQNAPTRVPQNAAAPVSDLAQNGVRIEPDRRLIVVMATLEAAGIDTPLTPPGEAFRRTLQQDFQNLDPNLRARIKNFVDRYKQQSARAASQIAAPFVSLAYALGPAPDLADPPKSVELPADVQEVLDFAPLVREFYRRSGIEAKLPDYVKTYQNEGEKMHASAVQMVNQILGYLNTRPELVYVERIKTEEKAAKGQKNPVQKIETREHARRFFVVPNLLSPGGTVNFSNVGDDYFAVVPPGTDLSRSEARRAYLQFVVDPLILKNAKDITPFRDGIKKLLDARQQAGAQISPDVFLAVSRSLAAAIEAKEIESRKSAAATFEARRNIDAAQGVEAKRAVSAALERDKQSFADETAAQLADAYEHGAVLSFYFADQLKGLEGSGFDISSSLREMILSLDPAKESNRLAQIAEARNRAVAARGANLDKKLELPKKLLEIDGLIKNKNFAEAETQLKDLLAENPNDSRIYYTLGRAASSSAEGTFDEGLLGERLGRAAASYRNAILAATKDTDPALLSLSHVALGRILEFNDQTAAALKEYEAALTIGNVAGGAYNEAKAAKDKLTKKP